MACFEEKRLAPAEGFSQGFLLSIKPKKYTLQKKIIERIFQYFICNHDTLINVYKISELNQTMKYFDNKKKKIKKIYI